MKSEESLIEALQFATSYSCQVRFTEVAGSQRGFIARVYFEGTEYHKKEFMGYDLARLVDPPGCVAQWIIVKTREIRDAIQRQRPSQNGARQSSVARRAAE